MFGGDRIAAGGAPAMDDVRAARMSVLDFIKRDIARFSRRLGQEDRERIDAHLSAVRELEGRLRAPALGAGCTAPTLPARFDTKSSDNYERTLRAQIDIGVAALAAGSSQVLTLAACNGTGSHVILSWLGYQRAGVDPGAGGGDVNAHHGVAHSGGVKKDAVDRWFFQQVAYLLDKPKGTGELPDVRG